MPPHWTQTPNGAMLARATSHLFRAIISPESEGGCKEFLEANCAIFADWSEDSEQLLQYSVLFGQFETHMEKSLEDFAESEGESPQEIVRRIAGVADGADVRAAKQVARLLGGVDYRKFCSIMHTRATDLMAELQAVLSPQKAPAKGERDEAGGSSSSSSSSDRDFKAGIEGAKEAWGEASAGPPGQDPSAAADGDGGFGGGGGGGAGAKDEK